MMDISDWSKKGGVYYQMVRYVCRREPEKQRNDIVLNVPNICSVQTIFELQIAFDGIKFHIFVLETRKMNANPSMRLKGWCEGLRIAKCCLRTTQSVRTSKNWIFFWQLIILNMRLASCSLLTDYIACCTDNAIRFWYLAF
jgi:hypothetical protein